MNDIAFLAIILVFFVLATLFVMACDRIIGSDDVLVESPPIETEPGQEPVAA